MTTYPDHIGIAKKLLEQQKKINELRAEITMLLAALEMIALAHTVYDGDELTPAHIEIREAARAAGVTPDEYVMKAVYAAIAAARERRGE